MADTYTIQFRRGMYADFDTSKIRPGEPVAILGNDPSVPSGKALYIAFAANDVRRLCSIEDISEMVNAGEFVGPQGPKGEKGDKGDPGEKGADGTVAFESLTPEQKESLRGISIKSASVDTDGNLTIMFSDGDSEDVGNIMGPQGIQGPKGDKGDVGPQGLKGDKGDVGPKGDNMSDEQAQQIEQNKTDIASLKTETGSLKEDISTKITKFYASNQGETHLADSDDGKIMDMVLYGRSEQKQYSGKNLLNPTLQTTTQNGVTCTNNGDGTYTVNGTATGIAVFIVYYNFADVYGSASSLKMVGCPSGGSAQKYFLRSYRKGGNPEILDEYGSGISIGSFKESESSIAIIVKSGATVNNLIFKPMLTTDTTATYADFEPYTGGIPSPNPDYPQEIKSVVNPTVKVCGKNLWDNFKTLSSGNVEQKNGTYIVTTDTMQVDVTPSSVGSRPLLLKANNTYTFSLKTTVSTSGNRYVCLRYTNGEIKNINFINNNFINFVPERDVEKIGFILYRSVAGDKVYDVQLEMGSEVTPYEPYRDEQTVTLPYTLNAIPVSSGGNVTIDGQQYIADYVDVERGKLVRMVGECIISDMNQITRITTNTFFVYGIDNPFVINDGNDDIARLQTNKYQGVAAMNRANNKYFYRCWMSTHDNNKPIAFHSNTDDLSTFKNEVYGTKILYQLATPVEIDLAPEEIKAFKVLATYYPTTNISVNSEQLDGYTVFNYPISMANGWNYVKQQLNDNRDYIYDMDLQSAEAYVNSEYAVALTELEV